MSHKDGCDGKDFTYSGTGYERVRLCACEAEDHDPLLMDVRKERIRRRALRELAAFDQASATIVNNLVPYWASIFRKYCAEKGISRHEAMDLTTAMMHTPPWSRDDTD